VNQSSNAERGVRAEEWASGDEFGKKYNPRRLSYFGIYERHSPMSEIQTCDMTSRDLAGMKKKGQTGNGVRTGRDGRKFQRQSSPFPAYAV
jgi:hypothetical protein